MVRLLKFRIDLIVVYFIYEKGRPRYSGDGSL